MELCKLFGRSTGLCRSLFLLFLLMGTHAAFAANWVLRCEYVHFSANSGGSASISCAGTSISLGYFSGEYRGIGVVTSASVPTTATFFGPSGEQYTVSVAGSCALSGGNPSDATGNYHMGYELYVFPQVTAIVPSQSNCDGSIKFSVGCVASNYSNLIWETTLTPLNPASWQTLSISGYNNIITLSDLPYTTAQLYGQSLTVRVKAGDFPSKTTIWPQSAVSINVPSPVITLNLKNNPLCHGQSNGALNVVLNSYDSKIADFTITAFDQSNNPVGSQYTNVLPGNINPFTISGFAGGNYYVKVANNGYGNCEAKSALTAVTDPTVVSTSFTTSNNNGYPISCNGGSNGQITAVPSGGTNSYQSFAWKNSANASVGSTASIASLSADTYSVTFTDTNGCAGSGAKAIAAPPVIVPAINPTKTYNSYTVSCWNKSDGQIQASATGGVGGYSYSWNTGSASASLSGLPVNTYSVTVTDANSCSAGTSIVLNAPAAIDFSIQQLTGLTCAGDATASYQVPSTTNTIGTVSYAWSTGEATANISGKGAGTYSITVSDTQGCSTTKSTTLVDPPAYTVSLQPTLIKCTGDSNGGLQAVVKDASNVITTAQDYLWTKNGANAGESPTLTSLTGLGQGLYKVVITYNSVCKTQTTYTLSAPAAISVSTSTTQAISCYNATDANIKATASGGTGSLAFSWSTGVTGSLLTGVGAGSYTAFATDQNGCTGNHTMILANPAAVSGTFTESNYSGYGISCNGKNDGSLIVSGTGGTGSYNYVWSSGQHTASINTLIAGSYTATITDNNGCSGSVTIILTEPALLSSPITSHHDLSCFQSADGVITLSPAGGTGGYQYSKDNGVTWGTSPTFNALSAGSFALLTKDGNSCTSTASITLIEPPKLTISFSSVQPAFCASPQGGANSVVNGGTGSYQYSWANSSSQVVSTNANLTNVLSDVYTLTVKDANNCLSNNAVTITSTDGAQATWTTIPATCSYASDGGATITINSGQGPFAVLWPDGQQTLQVQNMKGTLYHVKITDANNCTVIDDITIPAPAALQLTNNNVITPTCSGDCDGAMQLVASGGTGSYTYNWNSQTTAQQTNLCAKTYPVVLRDANNCELKQDVVLPSPIPLSITTVTKTLPSCSGLCDGSLEIAGAGGNGGYSYTWAVGGTGSLKNNLCSASYAVSITDSKNCTAQQTIVLDDVPPIVVNLGGGATVCSGQRYTLDAGSGWNNITWSSDNNDFSSGAQKVTITEPGHYLVSVKDATGCTGSGTFFLQTSTDLLQASFLIPSKAEVQDTVAIIEVSWPLPESIDWDFPSQMTTITDLGDVIFGEFEQEGTYTVGLTAHLGDCIATTSKTIVIEKREDGDSGGRLGYQDFVKSFVVYPDPTDGSFDVDIELIEESAIVLSIWNSTKGVLINEVKDKDMSSYKMHFDLRPIASGAYILRLDHAKGKAYVRFIVY